MKVNLCVRLEEAVSFEMFKQFLKTRSEFLNDSEVWVTACEDGYERLYQTYQEDEEFRRRMFGSVASFEMLGLYIAEELTQKGVKYAEIRFAPARYTIGNDAWSSERKIVYWLSHGLTRKGAQCGCVYNLLLSCTNGLDSKANYRTISIAREFLHKGVCGVVLTEGESCDEQNAYYYKLCEELDIPVVAELKGAPSMENGIHLGLIAAKLGAKRIECLPSIAMTNCILREIKVNKIAIECTPCYDILLKGFSEEYPIKDFMKNEIRVCIGARGIDIEKETLEIQKKGFTEEEINELMKASLDYSFIDEWQRRRIE